MAQRILVAGLPRGGTTWVGRALAAGPGTAYVHEPDNWAADPLAFLSQDEVGRFPVLAQEAHAPRYDMVWRLAMRGGWAAAGSLARARALSLRLPRRLAIPALTLAARRAARRPPAGPVVAKTVQGLGALDWLAARHADAVVLVTADPRSVVSSWRALGWGSGYIDDDWLARHRPDVLEAAGGWPDDPPGQVAVAVGALRTLLDEAIARHPDWLVVAHEDLCRDAVGRFAELFERLGLTFGPEARAYLEASDAPGQGLETRRRTAEQTDRWRRLPPAELARAEELLRAIGR